MFKNEQIKELIQQNNLLLNKLLLQNSETKRVELSPERKAVREFYNNLKKSECPGLMKYVKHQFIKSKLM